MEHRPAPRLPIIALGLASLCGLALIGPSAQAQITLDFESPHYLVIKAPAIPGREIRVNYLEAYCRPGSTDADWDQHTVIPHRTEVISLSEDHKTLRLHDTLADGVVVEHLVTAKADEVDFRLRARNNTATASQAHWAQPCVRLGDFTGFEPKGPNLDDYLPKCFIFLNGKLTRLSDVRPWAKTARYTPGQAWCPPGVPRADVNPRPLSPLVPDLGLIGAFSADDQWIFATAWEPYQELFQGIIRCLHSDLRLGGLQPGETKEIRGKIYLVTNDVPALLARYTADFPEHRPAPVPVTPNASLQARALLNYIYSIYGKKTLSGQMWAPWGVDEIKTVEELTGKLPAIRGQDYIHERSNARENQLAREWWLAGGIPTIMWHWGAPSKGEGYEESKLTIDIDRCFEPGTPEHAAFQADLKRIADHLTELRDANIPILWRPMHEFDGGWFWYGKGGGDRFVRLWRAMFDYFARERNLNNLIWVLCHSHRAKPGWDPGKEYYDLAGADSYGKGIQPELFRTMQSFHGSTIPIPYHECGTIPDPDEAFQNGVTWSWWMLWHTTYLTNHDREALRRAYHHNLVLTRDELPNIMEYFRGPFPSPLIEPNEKK